MGGVKGVVNRRGGVNGKVKGCGKWEGVCN